MTSLLGFFLAPISEAGDSLMSASSLNRTRFLSEELRSPDIFDSKIKN